MTTCRNTILKQTTSVCDDYLLKYELREVSDTDGFALFCSYSVFASIESIKGSYYDERLVSDVTYSVDTALTFFDLISNGCVTPMTLCEVLEDLLAQI